MKEAFTEESPKLIRGVTASESDIGKAMFDLTLVIGESHPQTFLISRKMAGALIEALARLLA